MENESLDLREPGGQRWKHFLAAIQKKKPIEEVVRQLELKLPKSLRKAIKEFGDSGVSFADLLANRSDPSNLKALVRKCDGHEYAKLFEATCAAYPLKSDIELVAQFANSIVDRFQDQVRQRVLGNEWSGLEQLNKHLNQARAAYEPDIHRIASGLVKNRMPTVKKASKEQKANDAKNLLGTSLLGRSYLIQQSELRKLRDGSAIPSFVLNHLYGTRVIHPGETVQPLFDLLIKYCDEWESVIAFARRSKVAWTNLVESETNL
ncbi:MAG TPA: hypothetical protein VM260_12080, partial [Pirellula sp.]|nr:hypothetical protein [Pirellula sp.]